MSVWTKVSGVWKQIGYDDLDVKVSGTWKNANTAWVKVSGVWKQVFDNFNAATGGTVTTVSNYNGTGQTWKVHSFTSSGTFTVTKSNRPFNVLIVGGGGMGRGGTCGTGGAGCWGNGGGSGGVYENTMTVTTGAKTVTVGGGGTSYSTPSGGSSSFNGQTCTGGGSGYGTGSSSGGSPGGYSSNGGPYTSTITGTSTFYAKGGGTPNYPIYTYRGSGGIGAQRTGGDYDDGTGSYGIAGIVVIAYRIS